MPEVGSPEDPDHEFWILHQRWYAQPNDLIGGWCLMTVDKPPSQADHTKGEIEVGTFLSQGIAEHVATQHNAHVHTGEVLNRLRELREEYHRHIAGRSD